MVQKSFGTLILLVGSIRLKKKEEDGHGHALVAPFLFEISLRLYI